MFEEALKTWTEKQRIERPVSPRHHTLSDGETDILQAFVEATEVLIKRSDSISKLTMQGIEHYILINVHNIGVE